jgi:tRNA-Thr(GGU) m(6)t(6)A37 methyltransferase TsaA
MNESTLNMRVCYRPIGIIRTPYRDLEDIPHQPMGGKDVRGKIEIRPELQEGLEGLERYTHLVLLFHLHVSKEFSLRVKPPHEDTYRGLFATRSPRRPNSIGLSVVRLLGMEGTTLYIADLDILDETPLLDIKPFIRQV